MKSSSNENMMRIALAGSSGLAQTLAYYLNETVHPFIILSRQVSTDRGATCRIQVTPRLQAQPQLEALGYQITTVDYDNQEDLRYHLRGIDLVISTVSGASQINLIDAAAHSRVRRFIPAEFEGPPSRLDRSLPDRGRAASLDRLRHWSHSNRHPMKYTVFSCGVFYERFAPGGLYSKSIGASTNVQYQGSYLIDIGSNTAEVVERNAAGQSIYICMTSVNDVANFVVAALQLNPQNWPSEFRLRGERMTVAQVVQWAETAKGGMSATSLARSALIDASSSIRQDSLCTRRASNPNPIRNLLPGLRKS